MGKRNAQFLLSGLDVVVDGDFDASPLGRLEEPHDCLPVVMLRRGSSAATAAFLAAGGAGPNLRGRAGSA